MKKILVIEDERAYMTLISDQLRLHKYEVLEAKNGKQGLALVKLQKPDLVLLDIKMPVMDGMDTLHLLRKEEMDKKTKVIILTNIEPDNKIIGKVIRDEPLYYFIKNDIDFNNLLEKIKELLAE